MIPTSAPPATITKHRLDSPTPILTDTRATLDAAKIAFGLLTTSIQTLRIAVASETPTARCMPKVKKPWQCCNRGSGAEKTVAFDAVMTQLATWELTNLTR